MFARLLRGEEGQGIVEYGIILALVVIVAISALTALGSGLSQKFGEVGSVFTGGG